MKTYTEQELIDLVSSRADINFLAAAITPWHAVGVDAAILHLLDQGIPLKGYIMLVAHGITGAAIDENSFHMASNEHSAHIEIVQIAPDRNHRSVKEKIFFKYQLYHYYLRSEKADKGKAPFYWVVPLQPSYELIPRMDQALPDKRIQIILVDEGSGSYTMTVWKWWRYCCMESGIRSTRNILLRNPFFLSRLTKRKQLQRYQLLNGKPGKYQINEKVAAYYRKIFAMEPFQEDYSVYGESVLINTNMLQQIGALADNSEERIYREICERMEALGIPVVIKPHPREENQEKYQRFPGCFVESRRVVAQEVILSTLATLPYCVVGFSSTTLVTARALFGMEAISADLLLDEKQMKNKSSFITFHQTFANLIQMPETMDELIDCILNAKKQYENKR